MMTCCICGKRAAKTRIAHKKRYDLCKEHDLMDLIKFVNKTL